jgi:hypothetical protein
MDLEKTGLLGFEAARGLFVLVSLALRASKGRIEVAQGPGQGFTLLRELQLGGTDAAVELVQFTTTLGEFVFRAGYGWLEAGLGCGHRCGCQPEPGRNEGRKQELSAGHGVPPWGA